MLKKYVILVKCALGNPGEIVNIEDEQVKIHRDSLLPIGPFNTGHLMNKVFLPNNLETK